MMLVQPTPEQRVAIREALREPESEEEVDRYVKSIREWLDTQPHLPKDMDDGRLRTFLRGCKFSMEKVKKKLDMYYTMRNAIPEFFSNRDINREELSIVLDYLHCPTMPGLTPDGCRITFICGIDVDFQPGDVYEVAKIASMIGDIRLVEETHGVAGEICIVDASLASPTHFAKLSLVDLKKGWICFLEGYPAVPKHLHVINKTPFVDTLYKLAKQFLDDEWFNMVTFHNNLESLYKVVPKDLLPNEYGGKAGSVVELTQMWKKKLGEYTDWFREQEDKKANEALRPGAPKNCNELFGMEGSFRKLNID